MAFLMEVTMFYYMEVRERVDLHHKNALSLVPISVGSVVAHRLNWLKPTQAITFFNTPYRWVSNDLTLPHAHKVTPMRNGKSSRTLLATTIIITLNHRIIGVGFSLYLQRLPFEVRSQRVSLYYS